MRARSWYKFLGRRFCPLSYLKANGFSSRGFRKHIQVPRPFYRGTDELTKHRSSLSLSDREGPGLRLRKEQAIIEHTIATRFLTKCPLNIDAISRTFTPLWRSKVGFKIKNNGDHIILFYFDNGVDVDKILSLEPWSFDKHLMVLSRYTKDTSLEECDFNRVSFWVQVYDIPLHF